MVLRRSSQTLGHQFPLLPLSLSRSLSLRRLILSPHGDSSRQDGKRRSIDHPYYGTMLFFRHCNLYFLFPFVLGFFKVFFFLRSKSYVVGGHQLPIRHRKIRCRRRIPVRTLTAANPSAAVSQSESLPAADSPC
ncbi:unnamed protein product [Musa banksii]